MKFHRNDEVILETDQPHRIYSGVVALLADYSEDEIKPKVLLNLYLKGDTFIPPHVAGNRILVAVVNSDVRLQRSDKGAIAQTELLLERSYRIAESRRPGRAAFHVATILEIMAQSPDFPVNKDQMVEIPLERKVLAMISGMAREWVQRCLIEIAYAKGNGPEFQPGFKKIPYQIGTAALVKHTQTRTRIAPEDRIGMGNA